jgi:hypothetical protein
MYDLTTGLPRLGYLVRMDVKIQYEKIKTSFDYLGKQYSGEIVCSNIESKTYWFVFDQADVKPFGGSIEFKIINGELEAVEDFPEYPLFIASIKMSIDKYRKELCN